MRKAFLCSVVAASLALPVAVRAGGMPEDIWEMSGLGGKTGNVLISSIASTMDLDTGVVEGYALTSDANPKYELYGAKVRNKAYGAKPGSEIFGMQPKYAAFREKIEYAVTRMATPYGTIDKWSKAPVECAPFHIEGMKTNRNAEQKAYAVTYPFEGDLTICRPQGEASGLGSFVITYRDFKMN